MNLDSHISENFYKQLQAIIRTAGEKVRQSFSGDHDLFFKSDGSFATEVDIATEVFLKEKLHALFPEAAFIAEESSQELPSSSVWCWVIDPIDGTTNFAHGIPLFAIAVALTHNNVPVVAMIYDPMRDELFHAQEGRGFFVNETQFYASRRTLSQSVVAFDLPFSPANLPFFLNTLSTLATSVYALRKIGSSCLGLAYVAAGRFDGVILNSFKWWDVAAGILLVKEAGGMLSQFDRSDVTLQSTSCIATNSLIFMSFRELVPSL